MLIAGLGNPGQQYAGTPHNVGFNVVDELASRLGCAFREESRFKAWVSAGAGIGGHRVTLIKPATFMNASGEAVGGWMRYYKLGLDQLVVVYDDADLPLGRLRIRGTGGSGGHNGLRSVIQHAGGEGFARVRLGIGRRDASGSMIAHVLSPFAVEDRERVTEMVKRAADAVTMLVEEGTERAMNRYNQAVLQDEQEQEMES